MTSLASLVRGLRQWTEADAATDVGVGKKAKGNYVLATCVSGCA